MTYDVFVCCSFYVCVYFCYKSVKRVENWRKSQGLNENPSEFGGSVGEGH